MDTINNPKHPIATEAITVWRVGAIITHCISIIVLAGLIWASKTYDWYHWVNTVLWVLLALDLLSTIWSIVIEPVRTQKSWHYGINTDFITLNYGVFTETSIIIPMTKVQFVKAEQGPLLRKYHLYTLSIGTMRSTHDLPMLPEKVALALRNQIVEHANIKEKEVG